MTHNQFNDRHNSASETQQESQQLSNSYPTTRAAPDSGSKPKQPHVKSKPSVLSVKQLDDLRTVNHLMASAGTYLKRGNRQYESLFSSLSQTFAQAIRTLRTQDYLISSLTSQQLKDFQTAATLLVDAGSSEVKHRYYQSALLYFSLAKSIAQVAGDRYTEGAAINGEGSVHVYERKYDRAVECYQQTIAIAQELKRPDLEATSYELLALVFLETKEDQQMLEHYEQALKLTQRTGSRTALASLLHNLSYVNNLLGRCSKAIEYSQQARFLFQEMDNQAGESQVLYELGFAFKFTGQYQQAAEYYRQCAEKARQLGNGSLETNALAGFRACCYRQIATQQY